MAQPAAQEFSTWSSASQDSGATNPTVANIFQALQAIHDRSSTNETRQQASQFLESQKRDESAVQNGYLLASERDNPPLVRHFGLSLLENVLKHQSATLSATQAGQLRVLVLNLSSQIQPQDPSFVRNKVATLWAEISKRTWGLEWVGMDEDLVQLWNVSLTHKGFVLTVLETLSEDVIHHEDTVSSLRGTDLNRALVEVFTPVAVYQTLYQDREQHPVGLRHGNEGWLFRISSLLNECVQNIGAANVKSCALKALAALRSAMAWSIPRAISWAQCVPAIVKALRCEDEEILMVSAACWFFNMTITDYQYRPQ